MAKIRKVELLVLKAKKVKSTSGPYKGYLQTELYQDGNLKAIIPASQTQPKKGAKTYMLNGWKFALKW